MFGGFQVQMSYLASKKDIMTLNPGIIISHLPEILQSKMREKIRHLTEKLPLYYSVQRVFSGETEKKLR